MQLQSMTFQHDGVELIGHFATPAGRGPHPAVMVMHSAHGLGKQVREKVRALAQLGYAAVATDMYGGGEYHADPEASGKALLRLLNAPERLRERAVAWYAQLRERSEVDPQRIAAMGFCFGGLCVLELARTGADLKAVVSFHGLLTTSMPVQSGAIKGRVAIYTGGKDPYAPPEHVDTLRQELTAANARFQLTVFDDACHAFTDPGANAMGRAGIAYDAIADRVSWAGTVALLEATL
jgi:dienelactone hydrolase